MRPDIDTENLGMVLELNGRPAGISSSAAILGHLARSLAELCHFAAETSDGSKAG